MKKIIVAGKYLKDVLRCKAFLPTHLCLIAESLLRTSMDQLRKKFWCWGLQNKEVISIIHYEWSTIRRSRCVVFWKIFWCSNENFRIYVFFCLFFVFLQKIFLYRQTKHRKKSMTYRRRKRLKSRNELQVTVFHPQQAVACIKWNLQ